MATKNVIATKSFQLFDKIKQKKTISPHYKMTIMNSIDFGIHTTARVFSLKTAIDDGFYVHIYVVFFFISPVRLCLFLFYIIVQFATVSLNISFSSRHIWLKVFFFHFRNCVFVVRFEALQAVCCYFFL